MFENKKCEYCGEQFAKNDEIVVCPDCGSPYHRKCWQEHGQCAHQAEHAKGYSYTKANAEEVAEAPAEEEDFVEKIKQQLLSEQTRETPNRRYCERCGAKLLEGDNHCVYCGHKQGDTIQKATRKNQGRDPLGGLDPTETIAGESVKEVALIVKNNSDKLLARFKKTDSRKVKIGWSWLSFLFGYLYFFFRKLYKYGLIVILAQVMLFNVLNVAMGDPIAKTTNTVSEIYAQYGSDLSSATLSQEEYDAFLAQANETLLESGLIGKIYAVLGITLLVVNTACALLFDYLYMRHCKDTIARMRKSAEILGEMSQADFRLNLLVRGGVSIIGIAIGYMAWFMAGEIVAYLIEAAAKMFGG